MRRRIGPMIMAAAVVTVSACTSSGAGNSRGSSFEARPVIMPAQHATGVRPDPFGSLHVPADEDAYGRLSRSQQAALANALRGVDCAHPPNLSGTGVRVVCDEESYVYLVGAAIFTADDVTHAAPIAPSFDNTQWNVSLSLASTGADKMSEWTSRYHLGSPVGVFTAAQTSSKPPCGPAAATPCSDFLAYISDDLVVSVPVTLRPIVSAVLLTGDFSQESATHLARKIAG